MGLRSALLTCDPTLQGLPIQRLPDPSSSAVWTRDPSPSQNLPLLRGISKSQEGQMVKTRRPRSRRLTSLVTNQVTSLRPKNTGFPQLQDSLMSSS